MPWSAAAVLQLVHTTKHGQDKTVLSCLDPVSNFQVFSSPQYIWDWTVANWKLGWDKTKLSCLVVSCVYTADTHKTRQDGFVLSMSVVWTSYYSHCLVWFFLFHWVTGASAKLLVTVSTEAGSKAWPNAHPHCVFVCNVVNYALQLLSQHIVTLHICVIGKTSYLHI